MLTMSWFAPFAELGNNKNRGVFRRSAGHDVAFSVNLPCRACGSHYAFCAAFVSICDNPVTGETTQKAAQDSP